MPVISIFFGIVVQGYFDDHPPAYFHASCQDFEAFIAIDTGEVIHGKLRKKAARIVPQWALDHRAELMAN